MDEVEYPTQKKEQDYCDFCGQKFLPLELKMIANPNYDCDPPTWIVCKNCKQFIEQTMRTDFHTLTKILIETGLDHLDLPDHLRLFKVEEMMARNIVGCNKGISHPYPKKYCKNCNFFNHPRQCGRFRYDWESKFIIRESKNRVQLFNPRTKRWVKVNTEKGKIISHKKSALPYRFIRIHPDNLDQAIEEFKIKNNKENN